MLCPYCANNWNVMNGKRRDWVQQYKCNDCRKSFCETTGTILHRRRFPLKIIKTGIVLVQYVSTRTVSYIINQLTNIKVSHQSIYNWAINFAGLLSKITEHMPNNFTNLWHVDEKFVRVADNSKDKNWDIKFSYLWVVSDSNSNIISVFVSHKRDSASARKALSSARLNAGFSPEILVSDAYGVYPSSVRKIFGRRKKHIQSHFESKGFRGFKNIITANLWCLSFMNFYNHIRPSIRNRSSKQISFQEALLLA